MKVQAFKHIGICLRLSCQLLPLPAVPIMWPHTFDSRGVLGEKLRVTGPLLGAQGRSVTWPRTSKSVLPHHIHPSLCQSGGCFWVWAETDPISLLTRCNLCVNQPAWSPSPNARASAHAGIKTILALLGGLGGHYEAHLCYTARSCIEVIYRFFLSSVFLQSREDIWMS